MNGITLGKNIASLRAQRRVNSASSSLSRTFERLSSGQRINRAADDAAGLAVASGLSARRKIFAQGLRNLNDGVSALNIADAGMGQLSTIISRQRELAAQAANGSLSSSQRSALDSEFQKLAQEYQRTLDTTTFNGQSLLGTGTGALTLQGGGNPVRLNILNSSSVLQGTGSYDIPAALNRSVVNGGGYQLLSGYLNDDAIEDIIAVSVDFDPGDSEYDVTIEVIHGGSYDTYSLTQSFVGDGADLDRFDIVLEDNGVAYEFEEGGGQIYSGRFVFDDSGIPASHEDYDETGESKGETLLSGDFNGDGVLDYVEVVAPDEVHVGIQLTQTGISFESLAQSSYSLSSVSSARAAMTLLETLQGTVSKARGVVGSSLSRLAASSSLLSVQEGSYAQAEARIRDVDAASEAASVTRFNILQQTSTAVLAQANQQGSIVLGLLNLGL